MTLIGGVALLMLLCATTADATSSIRALVDPGWVPGSHRPDFVTERPLVRALYDAAGGGALWLEDGKPTERARAAITILQESSVHGLEPNEYDAALLRDELVRLERVPRVPELDLARFDVALSVALVRLIRDLHVGRTDPRAFGFHYDVGAKRAEVAALTVRLAERDGSVAEIVRMAAPRLAQYEMLVAELARYRALAADARVAPPAVAPTIRPGARFDAAPALARWLHALGDLDVTEPPDAGEYTPPLVDGVRRFQRRHGLLADGIVGPATAAALAVPAAMRARQITLALERLRWLPGLARDRTVIVNAPAFEVLAFEAFGAGSPPALVMPVIVGRALRTETPFFTATMTDVVFAPYWNVPASILRHEILPRLRRDPDYLATEHLEIVAAGRVLAPSDDALARLARGAADLRQRPGPDNALGRVKFLFPNPYSVYMHDTPARELFLRARRDFSHGCIRLSDAPAFARWVLGGEGWEAGSVDAMLAVERETIVRLRRPIAVVIAYATAVARRDGSIDFYDDVYGHDAVLERALAARASQ